MSCTVSTCVAAQVRIACDDCMAKDCRQYHIRVVHCCTVHAAPPSCVAKGHQRASSDNPQHFEGTLRVARRSRALVLVCFHTMYSCL